MKKLKVIIVSGLPGTGKSTAAEGITNTLALPIFSVDPIESSIIKSGISKSFETGLAAYLVAETLAAEQLANGLSIVIDAVSPVNEARQMWHGLAKQYNATLIIIECVLDTAVHRKRIEARVRNFHGIPEVTWEDVEHRRKAYLPWTEERLVLDTSQPQSILMAKALEYIRSK